MALFKKINQRKFDKELYKIFDSGHLGTLHLKW